MLILWMKNKNKQVSELCQGKHLKTWLKYRTLNSYFIQRSNYALICSVVVSGVEEGMSQTLGIRHFPDTYHSFIKKWLGFILWSVHLFIVAYLLFYLLTLVVAHWKKFNNLWHGSYLLNITKTSFPSKIVLVWIHVLSDGLNP